MQKTKQIFINILKGFFIGIGAIIPGLSGGTVAVITGVFEELLEATASFFIHIKKSIIFITPIALGAVIGVYISSPMLDYFCLSFPIVSKYIFCTISCISTFFFIKKSLTPEYTNKKFISTACGMISALLISFSLKVFEADLTESGFILLFIIGIPLALALVLPAISFSYMLLFFGLYNKTLEAISKLDAFFLIPLVLGITVGTFIFSKVLLNLIKKYPQETYSYVLGFVLYSVADILIQ